MRDVPLRHIRGEGFTPGDTGLYEARITDGGELATTVTERERNIWLHHGISNIETTQWIVLIDLSGGDPWEHDEFGRIDMSFIRFVIDRDSNATGYVALGVITQIDATEATVAEAWRVRFNKNVNQRISDEFNLAPSQWKFGVEDGALKRGMTSFVSTTTLLNTSGTVDSPMGAVAPDVGDIVVGFIRNAGAYDANVLTFYHGEGTA